MLYDAHNHLHDARLAPHLPAILETLRPIDLLGAVVNGTREDDWEAVAALAADHSWIMPSFGLHPWQVSTRSVVWLDKLRDQLDAHPLAGVGEIGLDRWIKDHDLDDQRVVFTAQLSVAAERNRPVTIHCIQAWGALWEIIRTHPLPACGFLIHAYGGPAEMVPGFVERGGYFSFSPYFLHERKSAQRDIFRQIPPERLLVETDAPDLRPPDERNAHPLTDASGLPINHPANIAISYSGLAEVRGLEPAALEALVAENFARLFIARSST
ncbi:MAG: TatD family hydrolase [Chthoniobacteraceae bacterium]